MTETEEEDPVAEAAEKLKREAAERKAKEDALEAEREIVRALALDPTPEGLAYLARDILGFTKSKIEYTEIVDGAEVVRGETREGDEYGINLLGPHRQIFEVLCSPSFYKHIEGPRDCYKTTCIGIVFIIQRLLRNPDERWAYVMDTVKEAVKKINAIVKIVNKKGSKLEELWPAFKFVRDEDNWTLANRTDPNIVDPTLEAGGVNADMTGSHRDGILFDDPVNWKNVRSRDQVLKTREMFNAMLYLMDPGTIFIGVGTRYMDGDLWGDIIREMDRSRGGQFEILILDCGMELYQREDKLWDLRGEPIFSHLTKEYLKAKLMGGHRNFSCQYMNQPLASEMQLFFRDQFRHMKWESWMKNLRAYILTDTATTPREEGCYSVVSVVGLDATNTAYLLSLKVGRWAPRQVVQTICDVWEDWSGRVKIRAVMMEQGPLDNVFTDWLDQEKIERQIRFRIEAVVFGKDEPSKDQRIMALSGRFEQMRFIVVDTVDKAFNDGHLWRSLFDPEGYTNEEGEKQPSGELIDQFTRFPAGTFKDIPDALAKLEAKDRNGRRFCTGAGSREEIREAFYGQGTALPMLGIEESRRGLPAAPGKWSMLAQRTGGGRYGTASRNRRRH